jgi:mono/diheme cytochrome c family protein
MKVLVQKIIRKKKLTVSLLLLVAIAGSAFFQQKEWKAPASADAKKNPLTADAATVAAGKTVYVKECQSCHGKKGKGDGPSAKDLDIPAGDFSKATMQSQSDGALFWKTSEGRKPMPSFKKKLNETQIWQTVIYMRTLKQ